MRSRVVITVFSADQENDPDILGIIGASAALSISEMPFEGPIGATRVGHIDGDFVINPTFSQRERSALDLVVVSTADAIMMLEGGGHRDSGGPGQGGHPPGPRGQPGNRAHAARDG